MALTDQPYLPFYVKDWLTNNKLKLASMSNHGLLINIMGLMHKEDEYGTILLKQKFKQTASDTLNFASMLSKLLPFDVLEIDKNLQELIEEKILKIRGEKLCCDRMIDDAKKSATRSLSGSLGGKKSVEKRSNFAKEFAQANAQPKVQANAEYENANENAIGNEDENVISLSLKNQKKSKKEKIKKTFIPPTLEVWCDYWRENGYRLDVATRAWKGYDEAGWIDSNGNPVLNWKQKCQNVWFRDEHRVTNNVPAKFDSPNRIDAAKQSTLEALELLNKDRNSNGLQ